MLMVSFFSGFCGSHDPSMTPCVVTTNGGCCVHEDFAFAITIVHAVMHGNWDVLYWMLSGCALECTSIFNRAGMTAEVMVERCRSRAPSVRALLERTWSFGCAHASMMV